MTSTFKWPGFILLAFLSACQLSEFETDSPKYTSGKTITFSIQGFENHDLNTTRTAIENGNEFIWTENDTVGVYPGTGSQVFFEMTNGAGANSATFDGGGWDFKPSAVYRSYYPFVGDIYLDETNIPVNYIGQLQTGNNNASSIGRHDFMYTRPTTAEDGKLVFSYRHLSTIIKPKMTLPAGHYIKMTLTSDDPVFVMTGHYDLTASQPEIIGDSFSTSLSIELDVEFTQESELIVNLLAAPFDLSGKNLYVVVLDDSGQTYTGTKVIPSNYPFKANGIYPINYHSGIVGPAMNQIRFTKRYEDGDVNYTPDGTTGNVVKSKYTYIDGDTRYNVIEFTKPLTEIDAAAFEGESNLVSITLPESVESIGDNAFNGCSALSEVSLGSNVKHIGKEAFMNCVFEEIVLPEGLESIDDGAFRNCSELNHISLPESLKEIGSGVFEASSYIESFGGESAFVYDDRHIIDGNRLVAFAMGGLGDYGTYTEEVPSEVKFIDKGAYSGAMSLGEIVLPDGLEEIGPSAFAQCFYLKNITIPASVSKIHYDAFSECEERIEWIKIKRSESMIEAVPSENGNWLAFDCTNDCPIYVPANTLNWYTYGQYWEDFGHQLGENNRYRILPNDNEILYTTTTGEAVSLPSAYSSTITNIAPNDNGGTGVLRSSSAWTEIPSYIFDALDPEGNTGAIILKTITLPDNIESIGIAAFRGCANLETVIFGSGLETIAEQAFSRCGLTSLKLPDSVSRIMSNAFDRNNNLTSVRIPSSLTSSALGSNPFNRCTSLRSFTGDNPIISEDGLYLIRDNGTMVSYACAATYGVFTIPENVTAIGENAMAGSAFYGVKMLSLTPPSLNATAFNDIGGYTIYIPDAAIDEYESASVWSSPEIKSHFKYYQSNRSIWYTTNGGEILDTPSVLPSGSSLVRHIYTQGHGMMIFSKEITTIPYRMFLNVNNINDGKALKTVSLPENVVTVGSMAFGNCYYLENVSFGNKVTTIEASAFYQCDLKSLSLPATVTRLNSYAFQGNKNLTSVELSSSITDLGTNPFADCISLVSFTGNNSFITSNGRCLAKNGHLISFAAATTGTFQIPSGITSIDTYAMSQARVSSVIFPSSLKTIGDDAMFSCPNLTSLTIPAAVTSIGRYSFAYCTNLTSVTMQGSTPPTLGDNAFIDNGNPQPLMPVGCKLRIPGTAASDYFAATNWSALSSYFELY